MLNLDKFLQALGRADALEQIQDQIVYLRDAFEIDHVAYHWVSADGAQFAFGTYDPVWMQRYMQRDYIRIDPVIIGCFRHFEPVNWTRLDWSSRTSQDYRADAIMHGVGNQGYSIPLRGPNGQLALLNASHTASDKDWTTFIEAQQRNWILVAHYLNQKTIELEQHRMPKPVRALSPRETDALTYLGMGYSRSQVALMLNISEHTLRAYIESARFKLGSLNTTHAVARAVSEGLIIVGGSTRAATARPTLPEERRRAIRSAAR